MSDSQTITDFLNGRDPNAIAFCLVISPEGLMDWWMLGEFVDLIDPPYLDLIFCHTCGHKLFGQFENVREMLRGSHSLSEGFDSIDGMCWRYDKESGETVFGDGARLKN